MTGGAQWTAVIALALAMTGTAQAKVVTMDLKIGDGSGWQFANGTWTQDGEGILRPPDQRNLHSRAFFTAQAFGDLTAEFDFNPNYRETGSGSAGLILRATDPNRFLLVYFPWGGQQLRAKHFWAAVAKVEGDAYLRNLQMRWVPGVPSETDRWYAVRVEVKGAQVNVWVDGRQALSASAATDEGGCIGLAGYGWYSFRNVRVSGTTARLPAWRPAAGIPRHAFTLGFDSQQMPTGCMAPNGDVLLAAGTRLVRSKDRGRTWGEPVELPAALGPLTDYGSALFRTSKGRLLAMVYRRQKSLPEILLAESADSGVTWSKPTPCEVASGWPDLPKSLTPYGPLVETSDGALLRFLLGGAPEGSRFTNVVTWGATHSKAYAIRSADGGKSWSAPIEIDRPAWSGTPRGQIPGSLDLTEPTGVAIGSKVTALVRPIYSQTMWQCWSEDGGATWDAAARATFPGYAQSMIRTASGVIVCAHRYPHYSVNLSRDNGVSWDEGTVVDYPFWAMGCLVEVEPNVVLCTYMNWELKQPLLAQLIRVTPERIEPAR
jgi:hypothetical protein